MEKFLAGAGVAFIMLSFCFYGWGLNLMKLTQTDFQPPYKAEVLRGIGVVTVVPGIIMGYIDIED